MRVDTPRGPARASIYRPAGAPRGLAVVLHGAGTDTAVAPLPYLCAELAAAGLLAVRFDQPFAVAGRRAPDPAHLLDEALLGALPALRSLAPPTAPLLLAGRSSGGRVACRIAATAGAVAIAALGFPLLAPQRRAAVPRGDRTGELRAAGEYCRVFVLQGTRDPFGMPARIRGVRVRRYEGVGHTPNDRMARDATHLLAGTLDASV